MNLNTMQLMTNLAIYSRPRLLVTDDNKTSILHSEYIHFTQCIHIRGDIGKGSASPSVP